MRTFEIDGLRIHDFSSFVREMNVGFICSLDGSPAWDGNLDALNDYLRWPKNPCRLVFTNSLNIQRALQAGDPTMVPDIYKVILNIFEDNCDTVELILK